MLGGLSGVSKIFLITGRTDMRLSIDGLMSIIRDSYQMDPYTSTLYLFCGKRADRIKALYHDKTGFVLLYMRLDSGRFQWPGNASQARLPTRQEYRWKLFFRSVIHRPCSPRKSYPCAEVPYGQPLWITERRQPSRTPDPRKISTRFGFVRMPTARSAPV